MLREYRIIRDAAEVVARAAEGAVTALRDGRLEQEPAFTDRMLGRIEQAMDGYKHNGVVWSAKTLTDHGRNAQESEYGADFLGVLEVDLPEYSVKKGFLAQAKLIEPWQSMKTKDFAAMQEQCEKMLKLSREAYVFIYSRAGISIVPAAAVISSKRINPHDLYSRSIQRFYEEHFACFFGDLRINVPDVSSLRLLAAEYDARSAIQLIAKRQRL